MSAPLLTAEDAETLIWMLSGFRNLIRGDKTQGDIKSAVLQALADGRTRCVEVLSEEEHRARFEAWWCPPDHDEAPGFQVHKQLAWEAYLACARANSLVSEKK